METLRALAHGINPPVLAQSGLAAAIGSLASRSVPPAELVASRVDRYPEEVETAIYLCCAEALRNSARQAPGSTVRLRIAELDGVLSFSAACDGPDLKDFAIEGGSAGPDRQDRGTGRVGGNEYGDQRYRGDDHVPDRGGRSGGSFRPRNGAQPASEPVPATSRAAPATLSEPYPRAGVVEPA